MKYPFSAGHWVDLPALEIQCLQSGVRQFTLVNPLKEPVRVVIEAGNFPDTIQLFQQEKGRFRLLDQTGELMARLHRTDALIPYLRASQLVFLRLEPNQPTTFRLRLTNSTRLYPRTFSIRLYTPAAYQKQEAAWLYENEFQYRLISTFFSGIMVVMFVFTSLQYVLLRERLFGYYALYLLLVLLRIALYSEWISVDHWPVLREIGFVGRLTMSTVFWSFAAYTFFMREYVGLAARAPRLGRFFLLAGYVLIGLGVLDIPVTMQRIYVDFWRYLYHGLEVVLVIFGVFSLWILWRYYDDLVKYLFWGIILLLVGGIASLINQRVSDLSTEQFRETMIWMSAYLVEFMAFSLGLVKRQQQIAIERLNLQQKIINQLQETQRHQARLLQIRATIARDLHDELGSELSSISILSQVAIGRLQQPQQSQKALITIGETARRVMERMRDIVWSLQQEHNEEMSGYLRDMISRQVEHVSIRTRLDFPDFLPSSLLQSDQWRHFLLIIREALHNVVRHARATEVRVELTIEAGQLRLLVEDNGVGFWVHEQLPRTGLRSQQHRATVLGGQWRVESEPEKGTRVCVVIPVKIADIQ